MYRRCAVHCLINDATMTRCLEYIADGGKFSSIVIGQFVHFTRKYTCILIRRKSGFPFFSSFKQDSRDLFCSFLSAWLFHPFQYFFRIPVWLSTFLLSRSSRVFARLHAFHLVPSSFPSLVSFLFLPPLSLPSLNSNERTSFVQIEYSTKSYAIGLFVSSRGRR